MTYVFYRDGKIKHRYTLSEAVLVDRFRQWLKERLKKDLRWCLEFKHVVINKFISDCLMSEMADEREFDRVIELLKPYRDLLIKQHIKK